MDKIKLKVNRKKALNYCREDLIQLSQEELIDIIIQLQSNNVQLKNVISKKQQINKSNAKAKKGRPFDFSKYETRRIILRIAYLGDSYRGLAVQEDCPDTIEAHLFSALIKSCLVKCREESNYHRCGRTDKGVSASGQVISIQVRSCLSAGELNSPDSGCEKEIPYCKVLNRLLPADIRAVSWAPAPLGLDGNYLSARFDCKQRTYKYWFPKGSLNLENMKEACKQLVGSCDFRNLCKMDVANGVTTFIRDLTQANIVRERFGCADEGGYDMYYLLIKANAFLWHQIRCIAGVIFLVGKGQEEPNIISQLLDITTNPRKPQYSMAVDFPLNLYHCKYDFIEAYDETNGDCKDDKKQVKSIDNNCDESKCEDTVMDIDTDVSEKDINSIKTDLDVKKTRWLVDLQDLEVVIKNFQTQWSKMAIKSAMIRDIIEDLENLYKYTKQQKSTEDDIPNENNVKSFCYQSDCMLEGVKPKVYQSLLKRSKCESLENRIDHYVKKKRLKQLSESENAEFVGSESSQTKQS